MPPVTLLIIGAGQRGQCYADYARLHPDQARVVGVAEPRERVIARGSHRRIGCRKEAWRPTGAICFAPALRTP